MSSHADQDRIVRRCPARRRARRSPARCPCRIRGTARGFTIIELAAVIIIVSIVGLVVIVPSMSDLTASRQAGATSRVLHDLHAARQRAMARGTRLWVVFDVDNDRYDVYVEPVGQLGRANRVPLTDPATGNTVGLQLNDWPYAGSGIESVDIGGGVEVGFDYLGRALDAGEQMLVQDGTISLTGGHTLTIAAGSGHAYE